MFIQKKLLLFDSLGLTGFKYFIVDNDETTIHKLLYNFSSCKVKEEKLTLCSLELSLIGLEKLKHSEKEKLTDTAQNFFPFIDRICKIKKKQAE